MDPSIDSIASTAQRIFIYPNITKVDPSNFNVNEDLDALSKLLNTQRQPSPKSPDINGSCSNDEEECCVDVEERSDIQFIELINEMNFDDEESFVHQENEGWHSEEIEEADEEEQVADNEAVAIADSDLRFLIRLIFEATRAHLSYSFLTMINPARFKSEIVSLSRSTLENLMRLFATRPLARSKEVQTDMVSIEKGTCGFIAVSRVNQLLVYFLRCYYCAVKYPIGCWQQFISHVNSMHNVVEKMEADAGLKVTTPIAPADQLTSNQTKVCILQNVVLPRQSALPAAVNQPDTANINTLHDNASTVAKLTTEQILPAAECGTKWETYNSNFKWDEVWDSGSDAESATESCSPNMDHCYSQKLTAPLPMVALHQNGVETSKKDQDSNSYKIRSGQTDSNIVMDSPAVNQPDTANVNNTLDDNASSVAKLTTEQILPAAECGSKCETYWDSGSDAEFTSEAKSCSANMDHSYSQELTAPLPTVALNQNGEEMSKKEQDSNAYEICFGQTDSNIVMDFLDLLISFPVLWCSRRKASAAYDSALEKLYKILNIRWELNLTAASFQHSLEKIKAWYRSTLVYTNVCNSPNGYTGKYKEYFRKCTEFLPVFEEAETAVLLCNICDTKYHDEASLQVHKFQVHAVGQLPYQCGVCGSHFWHVDALGGHLAWHKKTYPLPKPLIFLTDKKKKLMNCEKCPRIYFEKAALDLHLTEHAIDERPYSCELCDERFSLLRDYRSHGKDAHNLPIHKCEICGRGFDKTHNFRDHMKVHRCQFDYLCDICGRLFVRQRNFKQHMQGVHQNLAHCAICNCDFKRQSVLDKHRLMFHMVREGEVEEMKSFTNPLRYRASALRRKYERVYDSPAKRYRIRCPFCSKAYFNYHTLHKHTVNIHGQTIKDTKKRRKRRNVGSAVSDLKCINEDEANPSVIEDNASSAMAVNSVPSEDTTTVVDSTSSKATAIAVVTPTAVTTEHSMPEMLFAKEETIQATTELKQLNTENFKIEDEQLFFNNVPEEAEFEYVLNAAAMELDIL